MHADEQVATFISDYFTDESRTVLLVAGAGFDPRARIIAQSLAEVAGTRLQAIFIREERTDPAPALRSSADENARELEALVPKSQIVAIEIFDRTDSSPVGGVRITEFLTGFEWPAVTDVVIDMSALSMGISFPTARYLLERCETLSGVNFHLMIASNPELDAKIVSEPDDRTIAAKGFAGDVVGADADVAKIWLPQLASRRQAVLRRIGSTLGTVYRACPVLPFPSRNPRRADDLIEEYSSELRDWGVEPGDLIYVSERNPLDTYRTIATLSERYRNTVSGYYEPQIVLSPIGSKVMAAGAMMAAIEHNLAIHYVESLRYDFDPATATSSPEEAASVVHIWLHGPVYAGYGNSA